MSERRELRTVPGAQVKLTVMGGGCGFRMVWKDLRDVCGCAPVCMHECVYVHASARMGIHACVAGLWCDGDEAGG